MNLENQRAELLRELSRTPAGAEFTCDSASMEPTIRVGDRVRVRAVPVRALRVGDVVVFEGAAQIYMLHRIVFIAPGREWFLHIGDAPTLAGPRRALVRSIVGRTEHSRRWRGPRVYLQAAGNALRARTQRYFYW